MKGRIEIMIIARREMFVMKTDQFLMKLVLGNEKH